MTCSIIRTFSQIQILTASLFLFHKLNIQWQKYVLKTVENMIEITLEKSKIFQVYSNTTSSFCLTVAQQKSTSTIITSRVPLHSYRYRLLVYSLSIKHRHRTRSVNVNMETIKTLPSHITTIPSRPNLQLKAPSSSTSSSSLQQRLQCYLCF